MLGNWAISTEISSTTVHKEQVYWKPSTSKMFVSSSKKRRRFTDARLQAVLSRNMYSEQGLEARMRPPLGQVCHSLMVVSYWVPGSAQRHAAYAIWFHSSFAGILFIILPSLLAFKSQSSLLDSFSKKSFDIRIELLEFCPLTVL